MQDAGARRVGNAEGMRGIARKHDCALPAQYTKHNNARGHSLALCGLLVLGLFWLQPMVPSVLGWGACRAPLIAILPSSGVGGVPCRPLAPGLAGYRPVEPIFRCAVERHLGAIVHHALSESPVTA